MEKIHFCFRIFLVVILFEPFCSFSQDPSAIRSKCEQDLAAIDSKMQTLNADYEQTKKDLRAGLYCSLCSQSKTELDKSYSGGFYKHVKDVKGEVKPADQKQMEAAHQRYLNQFNNLKSQYNSKTESCNSSISNANKALQQKAENERQQAIAEQNARNQEARQKAEEQRQAEEQRIQEAQRQKEQHEQAYRQQVIAQTEQAKQDAIQMFTENANRIKDAISGISMPNETIGFQGNSNTSAGNSNPASPHSNVDEYEPEQFENGRTTNTPGDRFINNYSEQFKSTVDEVLTDMSIGESNLPNIFKTGYNLYSQLKTYGNAFSDLSNGNITQDVVDAHFSVTQNSLIQGIQKFTGGIAVRNSETILNLLDRTFQDDFSEKDIDDAVRQMSPGYAIAGMFHPSQDRPWTAKNTAILIAGGAVMATAGVPIWIGIGVAAWYGFKH